MEVQSLKLKDFYSLSDLRNQVLDFEDHIKYYPELDKDYTSNEFKVDFLIEMTESQMKKFRGMLFDYGKETNPITYHGYRIKMI